MTHDTFSIIAKLKAPLPNMVDYLCEPVSLTCHICATFTQQNVK